MENILENNNYYINIKKKQKQQESLPQPWIAIDAEGGDVTYIMVGQIQYKIHTFTSSSTFSVSNRGTDGTVQYFMVGGGGAGGAGRFCNTFCAPQQFACAGHGGYGGSILSGSTSIAVQSYNVVVGAGGLGVASAAAGGNGGTSSFSSFSVSGGIGRVGVEFSITNFPTWQTSLANTVVVGIGASGGKNGISSSFNGTSSYYSGGGAAGDAGLSGVAAADSVGGLGGGGNTGQSGSVNTGGGGGGAPLGSNSASYTKGGNGGSGIVMIRYPLQNPNP